MAKESSSQNKSRAITAAWLSNAGKSVGAATVAKFKEMAPNLTESGTGMYRGGKKVISTLKPANVVRLGRELSRNKYVKQAQDSIRQAKKDIKEGHLYNNERVDEAMLASQFGDSFANFDSFDDFEGNEFSDFSSESSQVEAKKASVFALTSAVAQSAEATISSAEAIIANNMGMMTSVISEVQSGFGEVSKQLDTVNSNLRALVDFQNENTTRFYQDALQTLKNLAPPQPEYDYQSSDDPMDVFNSGGTLNFDSYRQYLEKNIKKKFDKSMIGSMWKMAGPDMINSIMADPVGSITSMVVGGLVPEVIERTIKSVDKTFGQLTTNLLLEVGKWDKPGNSNFKRFIGSIFGVQPSAVEQTTSMQAIDKNVATFDNITRNSIVEVLPKYARESTAYLKEIAMHLTKKSNEEILNGSEVFSARENAYIRRGNLKNRFLGETSDLMKGTFSGTEFGEAIRSIEYSLSGKDKDAFSAAISKLATRLGTTENVLTERDYDINNKDSKINKLLENIGGKKETALIKEAIKYLYDNNTSAIGDAAKTQQVLRDAWNRNMRTISKDFDLNNLHAMGIDNTTDLVKMLTDYQNETYKDNLGGRKGRKWKNKVELVGTLGGGKGDISDVVRSSIDNWQREEDELVSTGGSIAAKIFGKEFGQTFKNIGTHANNSMHAIMKGDSLGAMKEFGAIFTDQMKNMWEGAKTHFLTPLSERLFGKDESGKAVGLFAGVQNKLSDTYKSVLQKVNGQEYTDSKGNIVTAEPGTSLVDKAADAFKGMKDRVNGFLFGADSIDKDGNPVHKEGLFSTMKDAFHQGVDGWKEALFGDEDDPEKAATEVKKKIKDAMPAMGKGAAIGALFGTLAGGPIAGMVGGTLGGAALGAAGGLLSKSEKFMDYMFGTEIEDEEGNKKRVGGLISENTQKFFKDNKNSIISGAALGAMKSMIFPSSAGLIGNLVGGPLGGAAMGAAFGMIKKSEAFQEFLYGNEEKGKKGIVTAFKDMFKGNKDTNDKDSKDTMKALGMGGIGAAGGALSAAVIGKMGVLGAMATPAGPIGGAILGTAVGIAAGGKKFQRFLFGTKDEETGERKGGVFQKFTNFLHVEVFAPMRDKALNIVDDMKITLKYDILETIRLPFTILADHFGDYMRKSKEKIQETVGNALAKVYDKALKPVVNVATKFLLKPAKAVLSKTVDVLYNFSKAVVVAPFKLVRHIGRVITSPIRKGIKAVGKFAFGTIKAVGGAIINTARFAFSPFINIGKKISSTISNAFTWVGDKIKTGEKSGGLKGAIYKGLAGMTSSEWRRGDYTRLAERAEAKKNAKADAQERSIMDSNRRKMAKALGYDAKYFTEENMRAAMEAAERKGIKLKFRSGKGGMKFEDDPAVARRKEMMRRSNAEIAKDGDKSEDMDVRQLTEEHRQTEILGSIEKQLRDVLGDDNLDESERNELYNKMVDDLRKAGYEYDPETGKVTSAEDKKKNNKKNESSEDDVEDADLLRRITLQSREEREKDERNNDSEEEEESPKKRKSFKDWISGLFRNTPSDEESTIGGSGNGHSFDSVRSFFARNNHARANGGPIDENDPYIVGERGNNPDSAEIIVPNSSGRVLSQNGGAFNAIIKNIETPALEGIRNVISREDEDQESILTKTLDVLSDVADEVPVIGKALSKVLSGVSDSLRGSEFNRDINENGIISAVGSRWPFGGNGAGVNDRNYSNIRKYFENNNHARAEGGDMNEDEPYLVGEGGNDPSAAEIVVPKKPSTVLSQKAGGIRVILAGITKDGKKDLFSAMKNGGALLERPSAVGTVLDEYSYSELKRKAEEKAEQDSDNEREEKILENVEKIANKTEEHHSIWESIFSKKGLLTLGAIAVGGLIIKNFPTIMDILSGIKNKLSWWTDQHAGTNGQSSAELAADTVSDLGEAGAALKNGDIVDAAGKFILDEGEWDANSGGRVALLAQLANKGVKAGGKIVQGTVNAGKAAYNVGKGVVNAGKGLWSGTKGLVNTVSNKIAGKNIFNTAEKVASKAIDLDDGADFLMRITNNGAGFADDAAKAGKGMMGKVINLVDDFFKGLITRLVTKFPSLADNILMNSFKPLISTISNTVKAGWSKITGKITAAIGGKGGAAAATFGISTAVFLTVGAINGVSGTARLFQVPSNRVDAVMIAISAALGAVLVGTVTGSIIDIIAGLIAEVCGFDLLNTIASIAYGALTGNAGKEKLDNANKENQEAFEKFRKEQLQQELEAQKAAGLVDKDLTEDEFTQGVYDGTYKANLQSYQDWNADTHKSIGGWIGSKFTNGWNATKKFFGGTTSYTDENGQTYVDNGKTWTVYDVNGKKLGDVAKDAVNTEGMTESHKKGLGDYLGINGKNAWETTKNVGKKMLTGASMLSPIGAAKAVGKGFKWLINEETEEVYMDPTDGSYYDSKGNFYNANGELIQENSKTPEQVSDMVVNGILNPHEIVTKEAGWKQLVDGARSASKAMWTKMGELKDKLFTKLSEMKEKRINLAFSTIRLFKHNEGMYVDDAGTWRHNGTGWERYDLDDNPTGQIITNEEMQGMAENDLVTFEQRVVEGNGKEKICNLIQKTKDTLKNAWNKITDTKDKLIKGFQENKLKIFATVGASFGGPVGAAIGAGVATVARVFQTDTVTAWTDSDGYYKKEGDGWVQYSLNNDPTGKTLTDDEMQGLIESGLVTKQEVTISNAKENIGKIIGGLKDMWGKLKDTKAGLFSKIGNAVSPFIESVKEKGIFGALTDTFKKTKTMGWYIVGGSGYYLPGDGKYEYYTLNNDRVEENDITPEEFNDMLANQMLVQDEVIKDSEAQKSVKEIKKAVAEAWVSAKDTVKSGWNKFKAWLGQSSTIEDYTETQSSAGGNGTGGGFGDKTTVVPNRTKKALGGRGDEANGFSYFSQNDPSWKNKQYISNIANDGATMGDSGCGPAAMAMVAKQAVKSNDINPTTMANIASQSGFRDSTGTNEAFIGYASDGIGLPHYDMMNPSADYIAQNAAAGNPMILNGVGGNGSAFTKAGHYVVAVGSDSNGNVLVNDPRGKSYSKAYRPEDLARETRKAWTYGGHGPNTNAASLMGSAVTKMTSSAMSTAADAVSRTQWIKIVRMVKELVAAQHPTYNQSGSMQIQYGGRTWKLRPDCTGIIACMLKIYGALPEDGNVHSAALLKDGAIPSKFVKMPFPGWDALQEGDILVRNGHAEIFATNKSGKHYVYNGGSTNSLGSPGATGSSYSSYSVIWRTGSATGGSFDGVITSGSNASSYSTAGISGTSSVSDSSSGVLGILGKVGNIFTSFASKALTGLLTGKWDTNFDDTTGGSDSSTSYDSTGATSSLSNPGTTSDISTGESHERIWKHLDKRGFNDFAKAGIMGCWEAESKNTPNRVEGDYLGKMPVSEILQGNDTMNYYTTEKLFPAYKKTSINKSAYLGTDGNYYPGVGLAQWTGPRGEKLFKFAVNNNMAWGDLDTQLKYFDSELEGPYSGLNSKLQDVQGVPNATEVVLDNYEMSPGFSKSHQSEYDKRLGFANAIYSKYQGVTANSTGGVSASAQELEANKAARKSIPNRALAMGVDDNTGGFGTGHRRINFGGHGSTHISDDFDKYTNNIPTRVDKPEMVNTGSSSPRVNATVNNNVNTSNMEGLIKQVLELLGTIANNTGVMENIDKNISSLGNVSSNQTTTPVIIQNNKGGSSNVNVQQATDNKVSRNMELARAIARG